MKKTIKMLKNKSFLWIIFFTIISSLLPGNVVFAESEMDVTYVDLTDMVAGGAIDHECVYVKKYDTDNHWQECSICGKKIEKENHSFTETWLQGDSCATSNKLIHSCTCGYNYQTANTRAHKKIANYAWNLEYHAEVCAVCKEELGQIESHYDEEGNQLSCQYAGICAACGGNIGKVHYTKLWYDQNKGKFNSKYKDGTGEAVCFYCDTTWFDTDKCTENITYNDDNTITIDRTIYIIPDGTVKNFSTTFFNSLYGEVISKEYTVDGHWMYAHVVCKYNDGLQNSDAIPLQFEIVTEDGEECLAYISGDVSPDKTAPKAVDVRVVGNGNSNEYSTKANINVTAYDSWTNNMTMALYDSKGNCINDYVAANSLGDGCFSYSFDITGEYKNEELLTIKMKDNVGNVGTTTCVIQNVDTKAPSFSGNMNYATEWSKEKKVTLTATDECSGDVSIGFNSSDDIKIAKKNGTTYTRSYVFTGDAYETFYGAVYARDKTGNITTSYIQLGKIDNTAPTIISVNKSTEEITKSLILSVNANDINEKLNMEGCGGLQYRFYSADETINENNGMLDKWTDGNTISIGQNGTYYVEVKDALGNATISEPIKVDNIDNEAPELAVDVTTSRDGRYKIVTISAKEYMQDSSSKVSGLKTEDGKLSCFSIIDSNQKEINYTVKDDGLENGIYKSAYAAFKTKEENNFIVRVMDNAGNASLVNVTIDDDNISVIDGIDGTNLNAKTEYPDWTNGTVQLTAYINNPSYDYNWNWTYTGDEEEPDLTNGTWIKGLYGTWNGKSASYSQYAVTENGTYPVYAVDEDNNFYKRSVTVSNIDKEAPTVSATVNGRYIVVNAQDDESGIDYIMIDGGSLETIQQKYCYGAKKTEVYAEISQNGRYQITTYDKAGNTSEVITKEIISVGEEEEIAQYTVTFCNYDDSIIKSEIVKEGNDATPPTNVEREGYTFTGWDKPYVNITEDTKITAIFAENGSSPGDEEEEPDDKNTIYYTVIFCNYDNSVIDSKKVEEGGTAIPPTNVQRSGYIFTGWSKSFANVKSDVVTKAVFVKDVDSTEDESKEGQEITYYTVDFMNYDNSIIKSEKVEKNGTATPPTTVEREGYIFTGWDKSYANVSSNIQIKALFIQDENNTYSAEENGGATVKEGKVKNSEVGSEFTSETEVEVIGEGKKVVLLSELTDEAMLLAEYVEKEEVIEEKAETEEETEPFFKIMQEEEIPDAVESVKEPETKSSLNVGAILILLGCTGAGVFYFMNKRFMWVDLPF